MAGNRRIQAGPSCAFDWVKSLQIMPLRNWKMSHMKMVLHWKCIIALHTTQHTYIHPKKMIRSNSKEWGTRANITENHLGITWNAAPHVGRCLHHSSICIRLDWCWALFMYFSWTYLAGRRHYIAPFRPPLRRTEYVLFQIAKRWTIKNWNNFFFRTQWVTTHTRKSYGVTNGPPEACSQQAAEFTFGWPRWMNEQMLHRIHIEVS